MSLGIRLRLSTMMFLQFFVWGAWAVTLGTYLTRLGFSGEQVGLAYSTTGWAAIISPLFGGIIADRFFNAEKLVGVLHLIGAGLIYWASTITDPWIFFLVLLAYTLCYMPTLALVNAISFHQMEDPSRQFPGIRVLGTIGWIAAGWAITLLGNTVVQNVEATAAPLQLAAAASLVMGVYSLLLLPKTPPTGQGKTASIGQMLGLDAISLMKDRSFAVFTVSSLLICIPLAFYYTWANPFFNELGMTNTAGKQSFGQMSEIFFMLILPFCILRFGVKLTLIVGMAAWAVRYVLFAFGDVDAVGPYAMLMIGILLHGICYDFFFVTGQLYVDKRAPHEIRASAQGFIALVTYGVGMVIGNYLAGWIVGAYTIEAADGTMAHEWTTIWLIPAVMAAVVALCFALAFREQKLTAPEAIEPG